MKTLEADTGEEGQVDEKDVIQYVYNSITQTKKNNTLSGVSSKASLREDSYARESTRVVLHTFIMITKRQNYL